MSASTPRRKPSRRPFGEGPYQLAAEIRARSTRATSGLEPSRALPPFAQWAEQLLTAKGTPYRFSSRPYLREIAEVFADASVPDVVLVKAVQIGGSELLTRLMLYMGLSQPLTEMYLFPAMKQMTDFYDARIRALIEMNPMLKQHLGGAMNKGLMRFGESHLHFRGAESIRHVIGVDVDSWSLTSTTCLSRRICSRGPNDVSQPLAPP